jgi:hypothetical protein
VLSQYQCPDCGGSDAYRSRRRNFLEKYLEPVFLLQPVRCANCFRRTTVLMFVRAREREQRPDPPHVAA